MHINLAFRETQIAAYSELRQTSKMKCLKGLKIVNGCKPLTIFAKHSM